MSAAPRRQQGRGRRRSAARRRARPPLPARGERAGARGRVIGRAVTRGARVVERRRRLDRREFGGERRLSSWKPPFSEVLKLSMVFDRRRRRAHRASRDARLSTGYQRAIDSLKTSEKRGFHEVDGAPCQAGAARSRRLKSLRSLRHHTPISLLLFIKREIGVWRGNAIAARRRDPVRPFAYGPTFVTRAHL